MKKRKGKYCNGTTTKNRLCCARAVIGGVDGKGYCHNHIHQAPRRTTVEQRLRADLKEEREYKDWVRNESMNSMCRS